MRSRMIRPAALLVAVLTAVATAAAGSSAQRRQPPRPQEYVLEEWGVRIAETPDPTEPPANGTSRRPALSRVVAIREGGPAHYAGLVPGDVVFQTFGSAPGNPRNLMGDASRSEAVWYVYYTVRGERTPRTKALALARSAVGDGRWIADVPAHREGREMLPGYSELRAGASRRFEELQSAALAYIAADPCAVRMSELTRRAEEIDMWQTRATAEKASGSAWTLGTVAGTACSNTRTGGLPPFEAALWAMTDQRIAPCSYDPARDYTAELRDPVRARWDTRNYYDSGILGRIRDLRSRDPQGEACLMAILKARLTGRLWRPAAPLDSAPRAPAPQPIRRGERRP